MHRPYESFREVLAQSELQLLSAMAHRHRWSAESEELAEGDQYAGGNRSGRRGFHAVSLGFPYGKLLIEQGLEQALNDQKGGPGVCRNPFEGNMIKRRTSTRGLDFEKLLCRRLNKGT